jgi:hypothetical protein
VVQNNFDKGPESWSSYDYHWSIVAKGANIFVLTTWERTGGVDGGGYVWADETRWSADTPESPVSVLPMMINRSWTGEGPFDVREAKVSAYLRGDGLQLNGSRCYFWVNKPGVRWHMSGSPLTISEGEWASEPNTITLHNDEARWYRSWTNDPASPPPLDDVLSNATSYGFSFVGFGQEPRGKFSLGRFEITLA